MSAKLLQRPTLVLNRNWQPVGVHTVARALVLLWKEAAWVVDPADYQIYNWSDWARFIPDPDEPVIRSVAFRLRVPEVVTLIGYDGMPNRTVAFSRRNLYRRDGYACQYCGRRPGSSELTIDHVVPRSIGGPTTWENCVLACVDCNKRKANRTPKQCSMKLRTIPARPRWRPLFATDHPRIESWSKFVSEAYWNIDLEEK